MGDIIISFMDNKQPEHQLPTLLLHQITSINIILIDICYMLYIMLCILYFESCWLDMIFTEIQMCKIPPLLPIHLSCPSSEVFAQSWWQAELNLKRCDPSYCDSSTFHQDNKYSMIWFTNILYELFFVRRETREMISGFVPSQLKEARLLANFRFY